MKSLKKSTFWYSLFLPVLPVLLFQACSQTSLFSQQQKSNAQGNGDPYTGKPDIYDYYDSTNPCADKNLAGKPLPNGEIQVRPQTSDVASMGAYLVRDLCQDITPKKLDDSQVVIAASGVTYQNHQFTLPPIAGDFDSVRADCPAGKTLKPNATRTNLLSSSRDWTVQGTPGWYIHPGIETELFGTIGALPAYIVRRNDSTMLDIWRRASQILSLTPNAAYAFTFVAKAGSVNTVFWKYTHQIGANPGPGDESVQVTFHLDGTSPSVDWNTSLSNVSATAKAFKNGYVATVYFTASSAPQTNPTDIGVTPGNSDPSYGALGDSIYGSAAQLELLSAFCQ